MIDVRFAAASQPVRPVRGAALASAIGRLALWRRNQRTRQGLKMLTEQQLADIGISPKDRADECAKWFWQR